MMQFSLTPEQIEIRDSVAKLMRDYPDQYWLEKDNAHAYPWEFYNAFAKAGYLGAVIPTEYGGSGLGIHTAGLILNEVAKVGTINAASAVHLSVFGINPVVKHGTEEQKRKYLPPLVKGDLHVCFGVTEPDAGTDTTRITTFAKREGDFYRISGKKVWMTKAGDCQKSLLLVRTTPLAECKKRTDGMSLFLADLDPRHVKIRPIDKMGRNAVASNEVFIDNLMVPVSDRIGAEGKGFQCMLDGLNPERILVSFENVGVGRAALRRAIEYARDRRVFGRPIGQNQGIQLPLADAYMRLEAAELMAHKAAWLYDQGLPCGPESNLAKYLSGEAAFLAADRAVTTHGGFGYAKEFHVERYFREARLLRLAPISENLILAHVAEHVLQLPRSYGRSDEVNAA